MVTILVIDDERGARTLLAMAFREPGVRVRTAATGGEALRAVQSEPFDWIVCDVRLPDMNGIELTGEIRRIQPDARIVLMSAVVSEDELEDAPPVDSFWNKPLDPIAMRDYVFNNERPTQSSSGLRERQRFT